MIESKGPTNTRIYDVAVYFRDKRLAKGSGHSIQEAEMNAALNALKASKGGNLDVIPVHNYTNPPFPSVPRTLSTFGGAEEGDRTQQDTEQQAMPQQLQQHHQQQHLLPFPFTLALFCRLPVVPINMTLSSNRSSPQQCLLPFSFTLVS